MNAASTNETDFLSDHSPEDFPETSQGNEKTEEEIIG